VSETVGTSRGVVTVFGRRERNLLRELERGVPEDAAWDVVTVGMHQPLGWVADVRAGDGTAEVFDGLDGKPMASQWNSTGKLVFLARPYRDPSAEIGRYATFEEAVDAVAVAHCGWIGGGVPAREIPAAPGRRPAPGPGASRRVP
jgi:hypothetical protein